MCARKQSKVPEELKFIQCENIMKPQQLAKDYHLNVIVHNSFKGGSRMISDTVAPRPTRCSKNLIT